MRMNWISDLGAPVVVTAVDLTLESVAPQYSKWATGVMAVGGYAAAFFMKENKVSEFAKNVGIASLPAFAKNMYDMFAKKTTVSRPVAFRVAPRVASPINRTYEPEFKGSGVL